MSVVLRNAKVTLGSGEGSVVMVDYGSRCYIYNPLDEKRAVGWLACVSGPRTGQSFELCEGKNYIGRGQHMAVQILGDPHVSHDKHAYIVYDPKCCKYFLVPGETNAVTCLEGKAINIATEIADLSYIRVGNTDLVFRSLCSEEFSWPTHLDEEGYINENHNKRKLQRPPPYLFGEEAKLRIPKSDEETKSSESEIPTDTQKTSTVIDISEEVETSDNSEQPIEPDIDLDVSADEQILELT